MVTMSELQNRDAYREWYINNRIETLNAMVETKPDGYADCQVCHNKRWVQVRYPPDSIYDTYTTDCACKKLVRKQAAIRRSGMESLVMKCGFENFKILARWQKDTLELVKQCLDTESWLLLCGQSGCGKTHLAVALCRELLARGEQVLYMSWPGKVKEICAAAFDYEKRQRLLQPYLDAPVLLVDDLFKTRLSDKGLPEVSRQEHDLAFELINHRYTHNKRTVITCEVTTAKLSALSEAITGRILEKAGSFVQNIAYSPDRNMRTKPA